MISPVPIHKRIRRLLKSLRASRPYSVIKGIAPAGRQPGIGFVLAALLSMFLVLAAQAQTDTSGTSSTAPTLTIGSSHMVAAAGEEVTFTLTASSAPSSDLPVSVHVRAQGLSMDTRTVADVVLPAGATTVTLRLEQVAESIDESRVDVTLTLAAGTGYSVGEGSEARVSIYYPPATVPESGIESSPTPTPSASPPDAPSSVQVSATATNGITVTWTAEAGETYRLEREAAYLFTYRVWQTVAEDLSGGSFSDSGLACSFSYLYEIRAKVTGSVYGVGAQAFGRAQACASSLSEDAAARARQAGAQGRPPAPRVVTDNPTATSIQIRFWHGNNPVSGIEYFETERTLPYSNATPPNPWPSTSISDQHPGSFVWMGLVCSKHYFFRARGYGNGKPGGWNAELSEWSDIVHGATWACTPPTPPQVVNVVTDRPTRDSILVRWDYPPYDIGFAKFKVRYRPANDPNGWVDAVSEITDGSKRVEGLTCGSSYYFQVSGKGNNNKYADSYGPWSDEVHGSTSGCLSPPPAPSNVDASFVPDTGESMFGVQLNWGGALGAASYRIERSPVEDDSDRVTIKVGLTATTFTVPSLTCGRSFNFWVSALGNGTTHQAVYGNATKARYVPITERSTSGGFCLASPPTSLHVTVFPRPEREVKLRWNNMGTGLTYEIRAIKFTGSSSTIASQTPIYLFGETASSTVLYLYTNIKLDDIDGIGSGTDGLANLDLAGNEVGYLFRVTANFDGTSKTDIFEDFVIRDDLILRVNGDSRGVANDKGKMVVKWIPVDDYTNKKFAIRYRKLPGNQFSKGWQPQAAGDGDWSILTDVEPTPTYEEPTPGNRTLASLHYPVEGLDRYQIYGVQLFYTSENVTTGEKVTHFSAREAYVFPSERQPDQGVTVGTFPFAGHFPSKTYTYSICRDSFDNDSAKQQLWVGMINHAFKQWETATDGLITMRPSGLPCTQYTSPLQEHHLTTDRTRSEIRMMNLEETAGWEVLNYFEMQADPFKRCVVRAIACATSYHGFIVPRKATNDLKASDITFNKFEIKKLVGMYETPNKPDSVSFNACVDGTSPQLNDNWDMKYFLYATAVHEGGHALGLMDWAVISLFHPPYSVAHATAKGSAMNYDNKIPGGSFKEPDCAPHPLDIMAIFALYQVVP